MRKLLSILVGACATLLCVCQAAASMVPPSPKVPEPKTDREKIICDFVCAVRINLVLGSVPSEIIAKYKELDLYPDTKALFLGCFEASRKTGIPRQRPSDWFRVDSYWLGGEILTRLWEAAGETRQTEWLVDILRNECSVAGDPVWIHIISDHILRTGPPAAQVKLLDEFMKAEDYACVEVMWSRIYHNIGSVLGNHERWLAAFERYAGHAYDVSATIPAWLPESQMQKRRYQSALARAALGNDLKVLTREEYADALKAIRRNEAKNAASVLRALLDLSQKDGVTLEVIARDGKYREKVSAIVGGFGLGDYEQRRQLYELGCVRRNGKKLSILIVDQGTEVELDSVGIWLLPTWGWAAVGGVIVAAVVLVVVKRKWLWRKLRRKPAA